MNASRTSVRPWLRTIIILPAFLFIVGFFQFIGFVVQGSDLVKDHFSKTPIQQIQHIKDPISESPVQQTIGAIFTLMGTALVVWLFSHFIDKVKFKELGFTLQRAAKQIIGGTAMGFLIISIGFILLIFFQQIIWKDTSLLPLDLVIEICLFILVAISEELLFRGYILNNWMQSVSKGWALIISSFMFSFLHILNPHFSWIGFCDILLAGIFLGLPYLYTRQLWFPIALHFSWNFFQGAVYGFNVSGQEITSLIHQSRSADTIWNGGKFGFEGSLLCTLIQGIAIGGLWWYYHQKEVANADPVISETPGI